MAEGEGDTSSSIERCMQRLERTKVELEKVVTLARIHRTPSAEQAIERIKNYLNQLESEANNLSHQLQAQLQLERATSSTVTNTPPDSDLPPILTAAHDSTTSQEFSNSPAVDKQEFTSLDKEKYNADSEDDSEEQFFLQLKDHVKNEISTCLVDTIQLADFPVEKSLIRAKVSYVESQEMFFVHPPSGFELVTDPQLVIKSAVDQTLSVKFHTLSVGDHCLVKYDSDEQFYRARVVDKAATAKDLGKVLFIDYGNVCSKLGHELVYNVPYVLIEIPALAVACRVAAAEGVDWAETKKLGGRQFSDEVEEGDELLLAVTNEQEELGRHGCRLTRHIIDPYLLDGTTSLLEKLLNVRPPQTHR